jgi:integrase
MGKRRYFGQLFERPGRTGVYIKFRFGGSRYCRLAGLTRTDAENYALELGRKIKSGQFELEEREREEVKFEVFAEKHLKLLAAEHGEMTYANEESRFRSKLIPHFKGRLLSELTVEHVERFLLKLAEEGLSPATRNRYQVFLSRLFQRAESYGYATDNPAAKVKRLREEEHPVPALSVEQQNQLIAAGPAKIRDYVLLSLDTGCRQGELLRLEWRDVDLERREILVRKSKSGKTRTVPLTERAVARLREMKDARVISHDGPDRVLANLPVTLSGPAARLFKVAAAAIGHPDLRPHDCRHQYAVNMIQAGVPITTVADLLGHSPRSIAVTMRYARHAPRNAAQNARDMMEHHFSQLGAI